MPKRNITNLLFFSRVPFPPKPISHTDSSPVTPVRLSDSFSLSPSLTEQTLKLSLLALRQRRKNPYFFLWMGDRKRKGYLKKKKIKINKLCLTPSISVVAQIINATDTLNCIGIWFLWLTALIIGLGISWNALCWWKQSYSLEGYQYIKQIIVTTFK